MRAAIFHRPGTPLTVEDVPVPDPGPGEVLIRVGRCGMCGSDVQMTSGQGATFPCGSVLGHEYAGEVVALGSGVARLRIGDTVAALPLRACGHCEACRADRPIGCPQMRMMMGGFGEYTLVAEDMAIRLPSSLSLADGALVEPLACSLRGAAAARLTRGERVLVLGAGAMGLGAVYWARQLGAVRIVASARSGWRESLALEMGASRYLRLDDLGEALADALGGRLPDVVFECTGAPGMIARAIDRVRPGGRVVCLGICASPDGFVPAIAAARQVSLHFTLAYGVGDFRHAVDVLDSGAVQPRAMIQQTVGLAGVPAMLETLRAGSPYCKVMIDPWR